MINDFHATGFGFLSNFAVGSIIHNGKEWPTLEHWYQAQKCAYHSDYLDIRTAPTPGEAKRMGQKAILRDDWEFVCTSVMLDGVRMKFTQNRDLSDMLIHTGTQQLIEGNKWHDNFWGDCRCDKCRYIKGENWLGRILMQVREELRR